MANPKINLLEMARGIFPEIFDVPPENIHPPTKKDALAGFGFCIIGINKPGITRAVEIINSLVGGNPVCNHGRGPRPTTISFFGPQPSLDTLEVIQDLDNAELIRECLAKEGAPIANLTARYRTVKELREEGSGRF